MYSGFRRVTATGDEWETCGVERLSAAGGVKREGVGAHFEAARARSEPPTEWSPSAAMEAASSRVSRCSVAFVAAPGCDHEELFKAHYQRANRLNSVKILRCFPHCCPDHLTRSYCGSSLRLQVTGVDNRAASDHYHVFAHFRESSVQGPHVHDAISLSALTGSLQSDENTNAEWIGCDVLDVATANALLFEMNASRRWYYSWRSTRRNTDRLRSHVLEAIVVVADGTSDVARVVAVVESPPFNITSFRRSNADMDPGAVQPLTALEAALLDMVNASPPSSIQSLPESQLHPEPTTEAHPSSRYLIPSSPLAPSFGGYKTLETDLAWLFASVAEIRFQHVQKNILPLWEDVHVSTTAAAIDSTVVSSVVWWLCLDPVIHAAYEDHAAQASQGFLDLAMLGAIYGDWMRWLQAHINSLLDQADVSWRDIVAVGTVQHLQGRPSDHPRRLPPHSFDWENFVASARQYLVTGASKHHDRAIYPTSSSRWTSELSTVKILPAQTTSQGQAKPATETVAGCIQDLAVDVAIAFTQQLSNVMLTIEWSSDAPTLEIRSVLHDEPSNTNSRQPEATRLVLDGRYRSFNAMPHGESTLCAGSVLGGQCFGDYVGRANLEQRQLEVECFSWPVGLWQGTDGVGFVCRWRWRLPLSMVDAGTFLMAVDVSKALVAGVDREGLACESVGARLEQVRGKWQSISTVRSTYRRLGDTMQS